MGETQDSFSFPCIDDILNETVENSSKNKPKSKKDNLANKNSPTQSGSCSPLLVTPTKSYFPKTPKKLITKFTFNRIQKNKAKLDTTKEYLQKFSTNGEQIAHDDSKITNNEIVGDLNLVDGINAADRFVDLTRCKISFGSGGLNIFTKISTDEKSPKENVLPNFDDFKENSDHLLSYLFNCLAFSRCDTDAKNFTNMFLTVYKSSLTPWLPKLEQFLAILGAYGADLNIFSKFLAANMDVFSMKNALVDTFFVPVSRLNDNLAGLLNLLNQILTSPANLTSLDQWILIIIVLFLDSTFYCKTNMQISCKDFFNKLLDEARIVKISEEVLINAILNLPLVHSDWKNVCYIFDSDEVGRLFVSHLVPKFGRKMFGVVAAGNSQPTAETAVFKKCSDIDEISSILDEIEQNLSKLLTEERDMCYSWLSLLNSCLSLEYLNQQKRENVQRFIILFSRWNRLTTTYGMSEDESRLKTFVYSIMNRLDGYEKTSDNAVFIFRQNEDNMLKILNENEVEMNSFQENIEMDQNLDSFELASQ